MTFALNIKIKKLFENAFLFFFLCPLIAASIWLVASALCSLGQSRAELQTGFERVEEVARKNQALQNEIQLLRTDRTYFEPVARQKLNLIKENEVIYRFETGYMLTEREH